MNEPVRILFANIPQLTFQVLEQFLAKNQNFVLEGLVQGEIEVLMALKDGVDVVVLGVPDENQIPGLCSHILNEYPFVKILTLKVSFDQAAGYWLGIRKKLYVLPTPDALIQSINELYTMDIMD